MQSALDTATVAAAAPINNALRAATEAIAGPTAGAGAAATDAAAANTIEPLSLASKCNWELHTHTHWRTRRSVYNLQANDWRLAGWLVVAVAVADGARSE